MPSKKTSMRRRKKNQGCCDELDHIFVACIKLGAFIEVILFAALGAAIAIYIVSTSTSGKNVESAVYSNQYTGIDEWIVRMYYKDDKCITTQKSSRSNGFRLNYCMPHYGTSDKIILNKTTLIRNVYSGDLCSGKLISSTAYATSLVDETEKSCTKVSAVPGDVLIPPSGDNWYRDILLVSEKNADPRNPTTADVPLAFLKAEEPIAPPDITAEYEIGLGRMGNGDCFVQAMEKLNHGIFVAKPDLTDCIEKGQDGTVWLGCLGIADDALATEEMRAKKIDALTNTLDYPDPSKCIGKHNKWMYVWTYDGLKATYGDNIESVWLQSFFWGVGIVIISLIGINALQEVYFMLTQKDYKVDF